MEPLFRTTTQYTLEEYARYNKTIQNKLMKRPLLIAALMAAALVLAVLVDDPSLKAGLTIGILTVPVFIFFFDRFLIKRAYRSNRLLQDITSEFLFFEDHFEQHSSVGVSTIPYGKIFKLLETPTNFYIMIAKNQGFILVKENCSPQLTQFIHGLTASSKSAL